VKEKKMANNRMYLYCEGCKNHLILGKTFGDGYCCFYENMTKKMDEFLKEHAWCQEFENNFSIKYEHAEDKSKELE